MFRSIARCGVNAAKRSVRPQRAAPVIGARSFSSEEKSTAEVDAYYEAYFKRPEIDKWELRTALYEMHRKDMVPNPTICEAVLKACRKLNDYALTTRFLETLKFKSRFEPKLYPYIIKQIEPVMKELGISTPEELGIDKPELWLRYPDDVF